MKKISEIINDLIEFADANGVLGDGSISIKIGNLEIHKTVPLDLEEEPPTVEEIMNSDKSKSEMARKRFYNYGNVINDKEV